MHRPISTENDLEVVILMALRRAKRQRRRPSTYVVRVVDGIVTFLEAAPYGTRDDRHVDNW